MERKKQQQKLLVIMAWNSDSNAIQFFLFHRDNFLWRKKKTIKKNTEPLTILLPFKSKTRGINFEESQSDINFCIFFNTNFLFFCFNDKLHYYCTKSCGKMPLIGSRVARRAKLRDKRGQVKFFSQLRVWVKALVWFLINRLRERAIAMISSSG